MKYPPPPSRSELATPDTATFKGITDAYFAQVDTDELLRSITREDFAAGLWRPFGFLAIHALPTDERWDRQLRVHIWQAISPSQEKSLPKENPHAHGAHMKSKVLLNTYAERLITAHNNPDNETPTHVAFERQPALSPLWQRGNEITMTEGAVDEYQAGSTHFIAAHELHKTLNSPRDLAVTFMLRGAVLGPEAAIHPVTTQIMPSFPDSTRLSAQNLEALWQDFAVARQQ
jgi:hypothetical protein